MKTVKNSKILHKSFDFCFLFLAVTFLLCLFTFDLAFADPASTNYQIAESYLPASGGNALSTNYKVDEGTVDYYTKSTASSTNYAVQGKVGTSGIDKLPVINSITPAAYNRYFSDQSTSYVVSATSTDGDSLQYRAKEDGTTKVAAQSSSTLSWALGSSDLGRRVMRFEVIDPDGTVIKEQPAFIMRHPVK